MYSIDWTGLLSRSATGRTTVAGELPIAQGRLGLLARWFAVPRVSSTVWCLGLTSLLTDVSSEMVSSVLPVYLLLHLRLTPLTFGVVDGLYQGFAALVRVGGGFAADRWRSHKGVAAAGYGLSAACKLGLLAAGNAWTLVAATIAIDRTGKGIRTAPRDALISLSTAPSALATAFGVHRALDAAGAMLGPVVAFLLLMALPGAFDAVFVVSFCVAMIGLAVILFFVDGSRHVTGDAKPSPTMAEAFGLLWTARFRSLLLAGGLVALATISDSFVFLTLQRQVGFGAGYFPLLYVGVAATHCLLAMPLGRIADRFGRARTFIAGHGVLLLVYAVLVAPGADVPRLMVAVLLFGVYYAATDGVLAALASSTLAQDCRGSGLALLATVTNVGRLLASVLFGAVWTWFGLTNAIVLFGAALAVAIGMASPALRAACAPEQSVAAD
jgi:MFS family permease